MWRQCRLDEAFDYNAIDSAVPKHTMTGVLFSLGKPRPQGGVRVNWLCLEITLKGVLEYWSVDLEDKEEVV